MQNNFRQILISPLFLSGLALLLLNDFLLKPQFHNFLTGKISDFAGLFIFALFWTALFPRRKFSFLIFIAVLFVFWKSPLADGLIDLWNRLLFFKIGRTVDYGDLSALVVLPAAWIYSEKVKPVTQVFLSQEWVLTAVAVVSLFAFTATSQAGKMNQMEEYSDIYEIQASPLEVAKKLQEFKTADFSENRRAESGKIMFNLELSEKVCDGSPNVFFIVSAGKNNNAEIQLKSFLYPCDNKLPDQNERLKKMFEVRVIDFLKNHSTS